MKYSVIEKIGLIVSTILAVIQLVSFFGVGVENSTLKNKTELCISGDSDNVCTVNQVTMGDQSPVINGDNVNITYK